ncbi:MAG: LysM peptidoglycan-binding domain-containing protein, partial [Ilumatobacteraceae bacterium]
MKSTRLGVVAGPVLVGAFLLASCGGGETGATQSTINLNSSSTAFVVRPPATTEAPDETAVVDGVVEGTQDYEIQAGDYPYLLVERFGITLEDLLAVNEWASVNEFAGPGTVILIPPGGKSVAAVIGNGDGSATVAVAEGDGEGGVDVETTVVTIPDAGDNCAQGNYTILEGDYEGKVAGKFDVTVDALRAANANTQGYSAFYPGLEIA